MSSGLQQFEHVPLVTKTVTTVTRVTFGVPHQCFWYGTECGIYSVKTKEYTSIVSFIPKEGLAWLVSANLFLHDAAHNEKFFLSSQKESNL